MALEKSRPAFGSNVRATIERTPSEFAISGAASETPASRNCQSGGEARTRHRRWFADCIKGSMDLMEESRCPRIDASALIEVSALKLRIDAAASYTVTSCKARGEREHLSALFGRSRGTGTIPRARLYRRSGVKGRMARHTAELAAAGKNPPVENSHRISTPASRARVRRRTLDSHGRRAHRVHAIGTRRLRRGLGGRLAADWFRSSITETHTPEAHHRILRNEGLGPGRPGSKASANRSTCTR